MKVKELITILGNYNLELDVVTEDTLDGFVFYRDISRVTSDVINTRYNILYSTSIEKEVVKLVI